MSHTVQEALDELVRARTFRREPAEWAAAMVGEVRAFQEASADMTDDAVFGRRLGVMTSQETVDTYARGMGLPTVADFESVGLCESDALAAARGLAEGRYFSFEDAVSAKAAFDPSGRNHVVRSRVTEVAARFQPAQQVEGG